LTGFTTGPHLHFEVRLASNSFFRTRNPELWLTPPQGWGVLVGQLRKSDYNLINYQEVYVRNKETNQTWMVRTYGPSSVNKDDFYQENLVLSDLPAGDYLLYFDYLDINYKHEVSIYPGAVSYFTFRENIGFKDNVPTLETPDAWDNMILTDDFLNNNPIKP
jgi:murein DD-endopeptidase MepM/ murein hydrolase activator NlpD